MQYGLTAGSGGWSKFLAQGNNSSSKSKPRHPASNLEPFDYQANALYTYHLHGLLFPPYCVHSTGIPKVVSLDIELHAREVATSS